MSLELRAHGKRLGQPARTVGKVRSSRATTTHRLFTGQRLEGSNQHARRNALRTRNCVEAPVDAIVEVHIGSARWTEEWIIPPSAPNAGRRMRSRIVKAGVRLRLDDSACYDAIPGMLPSQHASQQAASYLECRASVEARLHALSSRRWTRARPSDRRSRLEPGARAESP